MNVVTRGVRSALRNPLRSGAIVIMLGVSIGLIVAMLVAQASVSSKIDEVKQSTATTVSVSPAGIRGGMGGGDPLTAEQIATISKTAHVKSVSSSLTDQLGTDDTNLTPSLELGSFGQRMQRFESSGSSSSDMPTPPEGMESGEGESSRPAPTPRTTVTGTTDQNQAASDGSSLKLTSGESIDGNSSEKVALVGKTLAEKNSLVAGGTFTMYGETYTVKGIFETGNTFQDSGIIVPLATLQAATDQAGAATSATVTVDSAENVAGVVSALETSLADKADITSQQEQAESSVASLKSISNLATTGVIGASIAAAAIILLTMTMIVRERRREIGVIKAIGGTNFKVITQFMTEAMTLTLIGGIVGLGFGVAASDSITNSLVSSSQSSAQTQSTAMSGPGSMPGGQAGPGQGGPGGFGGRANRAVTQTLASINSSVTPQTIAGAVGITFLIAIIGSAVPAWLIARVRPAEVLRTE